MNREIDVRKIIFLSYFVIPALFYFIPFFLSIEDGYIRMYFFNSFDIPNEAFLAFFSGYCAFGFMIYKTLAITSYKIYYRERTNIISDILVIFLFISFIFNPVGYIKLLLTPFFYIYIACFRPRVATFFILFIISIFNMLIFYDRYPVILVLMIWTLPYLSKISVGRLFLFSLFAAFVLIFILQPLRAGIVPFSGGFSEASYFFKHLFPMYIGAYLLYEEELSTLQLLAESIPFMKGILGYENVIDIIANVGLPSDVIQSGTRYGSNTTMYFDGVGPIILVSFLLTIYIALKYLRLQYFRNTILLIFVLQGPYFIRRSFGTLYIELLVSTFMCVIFCLFYQLLKEKK